MKNIKNNKKSCVIVYTKNGYKLDNGYGKFIDKKAWSSLQQAKDAAVNMGLEYVVA